MDSNFWYNPRQEEQTVWVAAYGSNLNPERLRKRIGDYIDAWPGVIPGYRLAFNKQGPHGTTYANIVKDPKKDTPAVAYKMTIGQLRDLDFYEGFPHAYLRKKVKFLAYKAKPMEVWAYIANPIKTVPEEKENPELWYIYHIVKGYRKFRLDLNVLKEALKNVQEKLKSKGTYYERRAGADSRIRNTRVSRMRRESNRRNDSATKQRNSRSDRYKTGNTRRG